MFIVICFRSVSEGCLEALVGGHEAVANMLMVAVPPVRNNLSIDALSSAKFSMVTWTLDLHRFRNMKV